MKKQIFIVGLDGGTFDLINEFQGHDFLPFFSFLMKNGTYARMLSVDQNTRVPISPTIWTSLASGKRAEKHNIKSFFNLQSDIKSARFFEIFNHYGYSVGNFGWELTWPPEDYGAFNVPCNMARDNSTIPPEASAVQELRKRSKKKTSFLSNAMLFFRLFKLGAGLGVLMSTALGAFAKSKDKRKRQFLNLMNGSRINFSVFTRLYSKYRPDVSFYFIPITDSGAHYFWKYHDRKNFPDISSEKRKAYGSYMKEIYTEVDRQISKIHSLNEDADIFIISDHGMKPIMEGSFETISLRAKRFLEFADIAEKVELYHVGLNCVVNVKKNSAIDANFLYNFFKSAKITSMEKPFFEVVEIDNTGRIFLKVLQKDKGDYDGKDISKLDVRLGRKSLPLSELIELNDLERSADHDEWGIFLHYSKHLKGKGKAADCEIYDFLPTLLSSAGLPVPDDIDGKTVDIGYDADSSRIKTYDFLAKHVESKAAADDSYVRDELKRLGYMKDE